MSAFNIVKHKDEQYHIHSQKYVWIGNGSDEHQQATTIWFEYCNVIDSRSISQDKENTPLDK